MGQQNPEAVHGGRPEAGVLQSLARLPCSPESPWNPPEKVWLPAVAVLGLPPWRFHCCYHFWTLSQPIRFEELRQLANAPRARQLPHVLQNQRRLPAAWLYARYQV